MVNRELSLGNPYEASSSFSGKAGAAGRSTALLVGRSEGGLDGNPKSLPLLAIATNFTSLNPLDRHEANY